MFRKAPSSFNSPKSAGFSAAPLREGAAQSNFRRSACQVSIFDPLAVQLPLFQLDPPAQRVRS